MIKRVLAGLALSLGALGAHAAATSAPVTTTVPAATAQAPDQIVRGTTEQMQALIRDNHEKYKADQQAFYKVVDEVLVPHFDVRYIAQLVLGKNWRAATEDQRKRFSEAFKLMLIRSYAQTLLNNYDSVKAEWQPLRMSADVADVTVRVSLMRKGGQQPVALGFNMRRVDNDWKIYDISVEAISLVANFRSQISSEIKRSSLDDLIARMEKGELFKPTAQAQVGS
jgi:phospholipid transport system substrate-binding protein